jgi:branched-chain amino acid transport system substrate-binding protein
MLGAVCGLVVIAVHAHASAATPDCGENTHTPATGQAIPVGAVTTMSGVASFKETDLAVEAYFDCVNANGGIHGRAIKYLALDDQGKFDIASQDAKRLVEDEGVYVLVGSSSVAECAANVDYYLKSGVLDIGGGTAPQCFNSRNIAEINSGPRQTALGAVDYARRALEAKSVVCLTFKFPGTEYFCSGVEAWGKKYHVKVTSIYMDPVSIDYPSAVLQVLAAGTDAVVPVVATESVIQLLDAAQGQDAAAQLKWVGVSTFYSNRFLSAIDNNYWSHRLWVNVDLKPDHEGEDFRNWLAVKAAFGDTKTQTFGSYSQFGYLAARIVVRAMLTISDPASINRRTVTAAIREMKPYVTDMLCGPWYWGGVDATAHNANHVTTMLMVDNGKWQTAEGCFPNLDPGLGPIIGLEKKLGINKKFDDEYEASK